MSDGRRQFLLTMWEGGGTIPPQLGVAKRLLERGHQVHVLGDPTIRARALDAGCSFSPWRRAPHRTSLDRDQDLFKDWEVRNPLVMLARARDRLMAGPASDFAADTAAAIESVEPDVLLADSLLLGTIIPAQAARIPVAALAPNIWMVPCPGTPTVGPGLAPARNELGRARDRIMRLVATRVFDGGLPKLNAAREEHGLAPIGSFWRQLLDADRILMLTSAAFDFSSSRLPPGVRERVRYVGPILDDPDWAEPWRSPWSDDDPRPLVLVALSSTFQEQAPLLRRVVAALSTLPVRALVTLGQAVRPDEVPGSDNVRVVASAPHAAVLPHAALVVTHCGHGTTMKALAAGKPLVCIPMGRDQNDTAARVAWHRAGKRLAPSADEGTLRSAVEEVLASDAYRRGAAALSESIASELRESDLVGELEHLASSGGRTRPRSEEAPEGRWMEAR